MKPLRALAVLLACAATVLLLAVTLPDTDRSDRVDAWWVYFTPGAAASDAAPPLSDVTLVNRARMGIGTFADDHPLPDSLSDVVRRAGGRIRHTSRWLRAISADMDAVAVRRLASHPAVAQVVPVRGLRIASAHTAVPATFAQSADSSFYGPNWPAIQNLGVPTAHLLGFTGRGVRIAILDTGFERAHEALSTRQVVATRDFLEGDTDVSDPAGVASRHGTQVWSILGGFRTGMVVGPAYEAQFILARVDAEPGDTRADEDRWVAALEWAEAQGARVVNSSIVFRWDFTDREPYPYEQMDGNTTAPTRAADAAVRRGVAVVTAMGNNGPASGSLSAPADADSVIAVGAVTALGAPASFPGGATARGPASDGRTKPEVSARGVGLTGATAPGTAAYATNLSGTSYSTALMSGVAAAFVQAWPEFNPLAVRRALVRAGRRADGPDNAVGAGVPDLAGAILFPEGIATSGIATIDLDDALTTIAPTFSWSAPVVASSLRPVVYRVEVARDPVFEQIILTDTVREAFSLRTRVPLRPALALWWRVVATGALGVRRTTAVSGPFSVPGWVRLLSPSPNTVVFVDSAQPTLRWAPLEAPPPIGPFTYEVQVLAAESGQLAQPAIRDVSTSSVRVPQPLAANVAYRWRVIARTPSGVADTVTSASPFVVTSETRPPATLLYQNFPNPFPTASARETRIWFDLAEDSPIELSVFDTRARLVRRLVPADPSCGTVTLEAGQYGRLDGGMPADPCVETIWDGTDEQGRAVPRGVYVLRLRAAGREEYRQIVFLGNS